MDQVIKILHTADLHLDHAFTASSLPYKIIKDRQDELLEAFDRIIEIAEQEKVDLLLISGDFFERKYIQKSTINYVNQRLGELESANVFILPGNHDPYHMFSYYKNYGWNKNIFIFTDEYEQVYLQDLDIIVHGIGFAYQEENRALLENLTAQQPKKINILMLHGSDMTSSPVKQSKYLPFHYEDLINSAFDYIALGHFHQYKEYKNAYGKTIAAYPGSPEPIAFDETGVHGVLIGEISKRQNNISRVPIAKRQYYAFNVDITDLRDNHQIKEKIQQTIAPYDPERNLFIIKLTGYYLWETGVTAEILQKQFVDLAYFIQIEDGTESKQAMEEIENDDTLLSLYVGEIKNKLRQETRPEKRKILKKAIKIGSQVLKGGVYKI